MKIDRIDVYWLKLPLAFVWKTSYADQSFTDTILVRMEGGGHHAWGESCPPYIPAYSADHTLAVFHTLREHMAPRIVGQDIETAQDLLDRLAFIKGNQFARAALDITWWVLDAKRRALPLARPLQARHDRAAAGRRRHEPGQPRGPAAADRDVGLSRRERPEPDPRGGGHRAQELPGGEHQDGPRRRAHRIPADPVAVRRGRHPVLGGRHARERGGRSHLRRAGHPGQLHVPGRHLPLVLLLRRRPGQARDRAERPR